MIHTYLLKNSRDSYYCGITADVARRLHEHNAGRVASTKKQGPWQLVYVKQHPTYVVARKHEIWLKKKNREYKSALAGQAIPPSQAGQAIPPSQAGQDYLSELESSGLISQLGSPPVQARQATGHSVRYRKN